MTRLSASDDTAKAIRLGMLALITPVMTSTDGSLGREHQVDADGPGHLGDPHDRLLDVAGRHHHQVVELVDHDDDEREAFGTASASSTSSSSSSSSSSPRRDRDVPAISVGRRFRSAAGPGRQFSPGRTPRCTR
jgi:hypothetical protein